MKRGSYIVCEGADLCGKSTLVQSLQKWVEEKGIEVICPINPGSTKFGQKIRTITKTEIDRESLTDALLFLADYVEFHNKILAPALEDGKWVIADRSTLVSGIVYQIASGINPTILKSLHSLMPIHKIDLLLILQAPHNILQTRARKITDRYESNMQYVKKVIEAYDKILHDHINHLTKFISCYNKNGRLTPHAIRIDASKNKASVFKSATKLIKPLVGE